MDDPRVRWVQVFARLKPGWTVKSAEAPLQTLFSQVRKAMMCRSCGVIEIVGDVNKLRRLTSEPDAKTERFATQTDGEPDNRFRKAVNE